MVWPVLWWNMVLIDVITISALSCNNTAKHWHNLQSVLRNVVLEFFIYRQSVYCSELPVNIFVLQMDTMHKIWNQMKQRT